MSRVRIEIEDFKHGRGRIFYTDPNLANPDDVARVSTFIESHAQAIADTTGMHPDNARTWLLTELIFRLDDAAVYEREADRRGVLAL